MSFLFHFTFSDSDYLLELRRRHYYNHSSHISHNSVIPTKIKLTCSCCLPFILVLVILILYHLLTTFYSSFNIIIRFPISFTRNHLPPNILSFPAFPSFHWIVLNGDRRVFTYIWSCSWYPLIINIIAYCYSMLWLLLLLLLLLQMAREDNVSGDMMTKNKWKKERNSKCMYRMRCMRSLTDTCYINTKLLYNEIINFHYSN